MGEFFWGGLKRHYQVIVEHVDLLGHVLEQTADIGSKVDDMGGLVLLEACEGGVVAAQVSILGGQEHPPLVTIEAVQGLANHSRAGVRREMERK